MLPLHAFAQGMSNDVALALQSWWQMPALPAAADEDGEEDDGEEDDGLPSPLGARAGQRASAARPGATSRKKKAI